MSQDQSTQSYAAGWYADTANPGTERFFDGAAWTQQTRTTASAPTIPLEAPVPTAAVFAADWYPDAAQPGTERFYDGAAWTAQTRPAPLPTQVLGTGATFGATSKKRKWPWIVGGVVAAVILVPAMSAAMNRDKVQEGFESAQQDKPAAVVEEPAAAKEQPATEVVATTVPDVLGITAREARALIENAGLEVEYQANKGVVLDQDNWTVTGTTPGAGAALNTGDIVVVQVTKTAELNQAAAPVAPAEPAQPAPPQYTLAQENALESAQSYLAYSGFSRAGLIQQLSSEYGEGYPLDIATWAVDAVGADWNAEAVESAQSYLEYSSFSRDGLYDQLTSEYGEGFTPDEANYALAAVGY